MEPIKFYSITDEHGELSNFAAFPIRVKSKTWPTNEHYFQAHKFLDESYREKIRKAKTPMIAARLDRDRRKKLRRDLESVKLNVMREALEAKFTQHAPLKELLLATDNRELIEDTEGDSFWGDGGDGSGRNMLGRLLMEVRNQLKVDKHSKHSRSIRRISKDSHQVIKK